MLQSPYLGFLFYFEVDDQIDLSGTLEDGILIFNTRITPNFVLFSRNDASSTTLALLVGDWIFVDIMQWENV